MAAAEAFVAQLLDGLDLAIGDAASDCNAEMGKGSELTFAMYLARVSVSGPLAL